MASLQKKGDVWYGVFSENYKVKWVRLGKISKHDAQKALAMEESRREKSIYKDIRKITFKELAREWLENQKLDKKPHTIASYSLQVYKHLIPFFDSIIVNKILPEEIEKFKRHVSEKVSATTVNYDLRILRSILDTGIRWGHLHINAAKVVKKLKQEKKQFQVLTKEQVKMLIEGAQGQGKLILMVAVLGGLRLGEILAMKWENMDWQNATYTIKESFSSFGMDSPKTESSFRKINVLDILLQKIREHKVWQNEHRLKMGEKYNNNNLIFATENGNGINPSNVRNRIFYPALKTAGLPRAIRFHDLRGTCATLLLESGANIKFVQSQLGHKTARVTLEIYAKVNETTRKESMQKLEAYLFS